MLELQHITLSRNGINLIENADARIHPGQRVAGVRAAARW